MPTTMIIPDCPACSKPMVPNTAGKQRNPKAPDWKCSDQNCKFQKNKSTGEYTIPSEYITSIWDDVPNQAKNPPQANSTPYRANQQAMGQRKEFQNTMDYKANQIANAQKAKEDSMRIYASGRDAVLITTALYPELSLGTNDLSKEDLIHEKIKEWQNRLANSIYADKPFI